MGEKVFVAMSGGVDSSVAALLLKKQGFDVVGVFMRCFSARGGSAFGGNVDGCAERDAEDARRVAEKLGIPFYVWDFEEEYKRRVVGYMVDGYRNGITPNPDVMCNKEIKFGLFLEKALKTGADYIATGHYVSFRPLSRTAVRSLQRLAPAASRSDDASKTGDQAHRNSESPATVREGTERVQLARSRISPKLNLEPTSHIAYKRDQANLTSRFAFGDLRDFSKENFTQFGLYEARDKNKDQSYFLWTLTQKQLNHCLFPIGSYLKLEVREMARKAGLPTADKKDSQGICFLGKVTLSDFLKRYIKEKRGAVLTTTGKKVGEHKGVYFYTIGQRHGLGIPASRPYYIAEKDAKTNTIVVAEGENNPALYKKEIRLTSLNWISGNAPELPAKVFARVRYRQPLSAATIVREGSGVRLVFKKPQKFVASGQSVVFYGKDGEMLGGGIIL